ncbi:hypothetical protein D3C86_646970 [compost metagenome]
MKEARLLRPFNFFCKKLKAGYNTIANIIAQRIGIIKGNKSLMQNPKIRKTSPSCKIVSKSCLLLYGFELSIRIDLKIS